MVLPFLMGAGVLCDLCASEVLLRAQQSEDMLRHTTPSPFNATGQCSGYTAPRVALRESGTRRIDTGRDTSRQD